MNQFTTPGKESGPQIQNQTLRATHHTEIRPVGIITIKIQMYIINQIIITNQTHLLPTDPLPILTLIDPLIDTDLIDQIELTDQIEMIIINQILKVNHLQVIERITENHPIPQGEILTIIKQMYIIIN